MDPEDKLLNAVSYNCRSLNLNVNSVIDLLTDCDICLLQEHWLYDFELSKLNTLDQQFF